MIKEFDQIESNHKSDLFSPKGLIFIHACATCSVLPSKYNGKYILKGVAHSFILFIYILGKPQKSFFSGPATKAFKKKISLKIAGNEF